MGPCVPRRAEGPPHGRELRGDAAAPGHATLCAGNGACLSLSRGKPGLSVLSPVLSPDGPPWRCPSPDACSPSSRSPLGQGDPLCKCCWCAVWLLLLLSRVPGLRRAAPSARPAAAAPLTLGRWWLRSSSAAGQGCEQGRERPSCSGDGEGGVGAWRCAELLVPPRTAEEPGEALVGGPDCSPPGEGGLAGFSVGMGAFPCTRRAGVGSFIFPFVCSRVN